MDIESTFVIVSFFCAMPLGGYLAAKNLDRGVFSGPIEGPLLCMILGLLAGIVGMLFGLFLYNAPIVLMGFLITGGVLYFAVRKGFEKNTVDRRRY